MLIPETVFFNDDGRVDFITTTDREGCVALDLKTRINSVSLCKRIQEVVLERKLETDKFSKQLNATIKSKLSKPEMSKKQESTKLQTNKAFAIVRFRSDPSENVSL